MPLVRLLGPIDVLGEDGVPHAPASPLRRTILALLAVEAGRVVDAERLMDQAWNGEPPESGLRALRFHISKLRREVPDGVIETVGSGYRLKADVDVREAEAQTSPEHALARWRGDALADAGPCVALEHERQRVAQLRLDLIERRCRALVDRGDSVEAVRELTPVCLEHPLRESLWAVLIEAHYASGSQADALRKLGQLRTNLVETLGVDPSPELQALEQRILDHDGALAGPKSGGPKGNLPARRSQLIGRARDVAVVEELIDTHRLITLTGPGGVGKTRLGLEAARRSADRFPDGAWLIQLGTIGDGGEVASLVQSAIGVQGSGSTIEGALVNALVAQECLLVLDNCEHVIDAVVTLVARLLDEAPSVRVIATSREGLGAAGERIHAVSPLRTDGPDSPAVELFRTRAIDGGWSPTSGDDEVIEDICRRLDGVPLALELAATRARLMPMAALRDRLDDRFRLLKGARRGVERHQTLVATVGWSYDLLDPDERDLFDVLAVFSGPFDLEAAEAVSRHRGLTGSVDEVLLSLVDKSMVAMIDGQWFSLLETMRQYGEDRLAESGMGDAARAAHLRHYADLMARGTVGVKGPDEGRWWDVLEPAWPNLRSAFRWGLVSGELDIVLPMALGLDSGGFHTHALGEWCIHAIGHERVEHHRMYPSVLAGAATGYMLSRADFARGAALSEEATALLVDPAEDPAFRVPWSVATAHQLTGRLDEAVEDYRQLAGRAAAAGSAFFEGLFLCGAAFSQLMLGRMEAASTAASEALDAVGTGGNPTVESFALYVRARAAVDEDVELCSALLDQAEERAVDGRVGWTLHNVHRIRADLCVLRGDWHRALELGLTLMHDHRRAGGWGYVVFPMVAVIDGLAGLGEVDASAIALGAIEHRAPPIPIFDARMTTTRGRVVTALGDKRIEPLLERGRLMPMSAAVDLVDQAASRVLGAAGVDQ